MPRHGGIIGELEDEIVQIERLALSGGGLGGMAGMQQQQQQQQQQPQPGIYIQQQQPLVMSQGMYGAYGAYAPPPPAPMTMGVGVGVGMGMPVQYIQQQPVYAARSAPAPYATTIPMPMPMPMPPPVVAYGPGYVDAGDGRPAAVFGGAYEGAGALPPPLPLPGAGYRPVYGQGQVPGQAQGQGQGVVYQPQLAPLLPPPPPPPPPSQGSAAAPPLPAYPLVYPAPLQAQQYAGALQVSQYAGAPQVSQYGSAPAGAPQASQYAVVPQAPQYGSAPRPPPQYAPPTQNPPPAGQYAGPPQQAQAQYAGPPPQSPQPASQYSGAPPTTQSTPQYAGPSQSPQPAAQYAGAPQSPPPAPQYVGTPPTPQSTPQYSSAPPQSPRPATTNSAAPLASQQAPPYAATTQPAQPQYPSSSQFDQTSLQTTSQYPPPYQPSPQPQIAPQDLRGPRAPVQTASNQKYKYAQGTQPATLLSFQYPTTSQPPPQPQYLSATQPSPQPLYAQPSPDLADRDQYAASAQPNDQQRGPGPVLLATAAVGAAGLGYVAYERHQHQQQQADLQQYPIPAYLSPQDTMVRFDPVSKSLDTHHHVMKALSHSNHSVAELSAIIGTYLIAKHMDKGHVWGMTSSRPEVKDYYHHMDKLEKLSADYIGKHPSKIQFWKTALGPHRRQIFAELYNKNELVRGFGQEMQGGPLALPDLDPYSLGTRLTTFNFARLAMRGPNLQASLSILARVRTVILVDDSYSMVEAGHSSWGFRRNESRWMQTRNLLAGLTPLVAAHSPHGVDLHFLNRIPFYAGLRTTQAVQSAFDSDRPNNGTPTGARVNDILDAYVSTLRYYRHLLPLNLIVITDGEAQDEGLLHRAIEHHVTELVHRGFPAHQFGVEFVQVGDCEHATRHLERLEKEVSRHHHRFQRDVVGVTPANRISSMDPEAMLAIAVSGVDARVNGYMRARGVNV